MPRPLAVPIRQAIWRRFQDGQDGPAIAEGLGPRPADRPSSAPPLPAGRSRRSLPLLRPMWGGHPEARGVRLQAALGLRREHPTWGAGLIRVMLRRQQPDLCPPAERTLQRWFLRAGLAPAPAGRRPATDSRRAERPHQVWQMDAAELVKLRTGQRVCWLRIADECSGAVLWTAVFPPGPLDSGPADGRSRRNSAWPLAGGGGPSGSVWTTACRGAHGVTCRPTWRCG